MRLRALKRGRRPSTWSWKQRSPGLSKYTLSYSNRRSPSISSTSYESDSSLTISGRRPRGTTYFVSTRRRRAERSSSSSSVTGESPAITSSSSPPRAPGINSSASSPRCQTRRLRRYPPLPRRESRSTARSRAAPPALSRDTVDGEHAHTERAHQRQRRAEAGQQDFQERVRVDQGRDHHTSPALAQLGAATLGLAGRGHTAAWGNRVLELLAQ